MGDHTQPGGGPLAQIVCDPLNITLPPSVLATASPEQLARLNVVQLEYARDASVLHAKAYEAALDAIRSQAR